MKDYTVRMDLHKNIFILESNIKGDDGQPLISLEIDENGQLTDPFAIALFGGDDAKAVDASVCGVEEK